MRRKSVLVCGLGIAGAALTRGLASDGFDVTVVERASALRDDGYMIDLWGVGYDAAERMELLPALRAVGYEIEEVRMVDSDSHRVGGFDGSVLRSALGGRFFSAMRGDLVRTLSEGIAQRAHCRFGDRVVRIEQTADVVMVEFERGATEFFDLVIGADGAHSTVRELTFGPGRPSFETYLGYVAAAFRADAYEPRDDGVYVSYTEPGRHIGRYALRDGSSAFFFIFEAPQRPDRMLGDRIAQRSLLQEHLGQSGWEAAAIGGALAHCDSFYFDAVSQVRTPTWSRGRVALVGDAAYGPSLLAGEGAALAMAGAYTLARELRRPGMSHRVAFANYEGALRPGIELRQRAARRHGAWFAPHTRLGLTLRNRASSLLDRPAIARYALTGGAANLLSAVDS